MKNTHNKKTIKYVFCVLLGIIILNGCMYRDTYRGFLLWADVYRVNESTKELLAIHKDYLDIFDFKKDAAKIDAIIKRMESGNINNADFNVVTKISKSSKDKIIEKINKNEKLREYINIKLGTAVYSHRTEIILSWDAAVRVSNLLKSYDSSGDDVLFKLENPNIDYESAKLALKFIEYSNKVYEQYVETYEFVAKTSLPAHDRKLNLEPLSIT